MSDPVSDDDSDDKDIGESSSSQPPKDFSAPFGVAYHAIGQEFYPVYQERCDNAIASANKYKRDNVDVTSPDAIFLLQPLYEQGLIPNMGSFDIKPYLNVSAFCMRRLCNVLCQKGMALTINESLKAIGGGRISVRGWINRDPLYLVKRAEGESIVKHGEDD
ncbi:unnamed protein product [Cuscuta campestris]|uniref:Uncharacterized protein n=1 Tax=Cuscuta campestris TaxID=132261 RepID=A0A484MR43_9ASTE|nr:unnamed protein product [Cuscuta campestris]